MLQNKVPSGEFVYSVYYLASHYFIKGVQKEHATLKFVISALIYIWLPPQS